MRPLSSSALLSLPCALLVACGGGGSDAPPAAGPQTIAPGIALTSGLTVAATSGGPAWVVWGEGDVTADAISAAAVGTAGMVSRSTVFPRTEGAQRELQVKMSGTVPVVAWRSYGAWGSSVRIRVAAYTAGRWTEELVAPASFAGAPQLVAQANGALSLMWQRVGAANASELVVARRSIAGQWSAPVVVASAPNGIDMGIARHAAAAGGAMIALWTEAPVATAPQPQVLLASRYDPVADVWGAAAPVDTLNGNYYSYDIAAAAAGEWMAVWMQGTLSARTTVLSKRWAGGAWAGVVRVDAGADDRLRELAAIGDGQFIHLAWTGLSDQVSPAHVRASTFDVSQSSWSPAASLGRTDSGYPQRPRLASAAGGRAVAMWELTQSGGAPGPFVAERGVAGGWGPSRAFAPGSDGFIGDVALPSATEAVATWFRFSSPTLSDVLLRRWDPTGN